LGLLEEELDRATDLVMAQVPDSNPRRVTHDEMRALLGRACRGDTPKQVPLLPGTDGAWLAAKDGTSLGQAVANLRGTAPEGGTSLEAAFAAAAAMRPPPDNIIVLTDGLPTQGMTPPRGSIVSGGDRLKLFDRAMRALPRGVPVNILLFPMEGGPMAAPAFWKLAIASRGSFMTPSKDWP